MSKAIILPPTRNLVQHIASLLPAEERNYSRFCIVFPGKRPAHFVRKILADRIHAVFIPPRIFSIDTFIDFLLTEQLGIRRKNLEGIDATAILYSVHRAAPERLGGELFDSLERFIPLGLKLFGELEELRMANVSPRQIREALGSVPYARFQALPFYYDEFYRRVEEGGYTTRSLRYETISQKIELLDLSSFERFILAGFYALSSIEQRIFKALSKRDNTVLVFQQGPGLQKHLASLSIDAEYTPDDAPVKPELHFYKASDTHGQVFAVNKKLKDLLKSDTPIDERSVIVLPSPESLFPVVHQPLALLSEEQYNIALGYPLERTPVYGFISSLMDVITSSRNGKFSTSAYLRFVLHPYTKNIRFGQRSDVTRVLIHSVEGDVAGTPSKMFISLEELEKNSAMFERVCQSLDQSEANVRPSQLKEHLKTIHDNTIRKFEGFETLRDFSDRGIEVLQYIYEHSTANLHPLFRSYAEKIIELFTTISTSLLSEKKFDEPLGYFTFLRNAVSAQEVPFPGTPLRGLQVLGLLETRNLSFDRVFMLDASDDVIPGASGQDVLLPRKLRESLRLETPRDQEKLKEYHFDLILHSAKEVHLFFTENGKKEKSRFLEKLLWETQKEKKEVNPDASVSTVRYAVKLSAAKPVLIQKTDAIVQYLKRFAYNATALDTYLKCQLQFYYKYVLQLREKEEVAEDVEQKDIGTFVHKVLKAFFSESVGRTLTKKELQRERLLRIVDRLFAETYGSETAGSTYLLKNQIARQLTEFLERYQIPLVDNQQITLLGLEEEIAVSKNGYNFEGRIDRIERRGEKTVILDYKIRHDDRPFKINLKKLKADDPTTWSDAVNSLQLPMYTLLYSTRTGEDPAGIFPMYLLLGRNKLSPEIEVGLAHDALSAATTFAMMEKIIFGLVDHVTDASVPFQPTDDFRAQCPACPFDTICGTQWVQRWDGE